VMVVLEEALSGFAIRKPPNDCERLKSPSMAPRPQRMWLRPSPFRDPGPTARPRLELGGAAVVVYCGLLGGYDDSRPWKSQAEVLRIRHTLAGRDPAILTKVTAQCGGLLTQQLKH
jgi:hypothetical protein